MSGSVIRIKRSSTTNAPTGLYPGESGYSYGTGTWQDNGDRLFIGTGVDGVTGLATSIDVIGGKFFTDRLDHQEGVLTAISAIVTDANNKIDALNVDNVTIDGNAITTSNANGDLTLSPNGTGKVVIINPYIGSDTVSLTEFIQDVTGGTIVGGVAITSVVDDPNGTTTLNLDDTAVTAGTYGDATNIPTFTVDAQGRLTAASVVTVATTLAIAADTDDATTPANGISLLTDTLTISGGTGVATKTTGDTIEVSIGQAVETTSDVQFNDVTVDGTLYSNDITAGTVTIAGNLTVTGTTTTVNTETISLADNIIELNSNLDASTAPTQDSGILVNRGSSNDVSLFWDETNGYWSVGTEKIFAAEFLGTIDGGTY